MAYRFLRFPEGKGKAVTLSYDDGVRDDIRLADTVTRYGLKCTFNYTKTAHLTKEEVVEHVLLKGHEIAVHGAEHKAEGLVRAIEGIDDVLSCRKELEKRFDRIIRGMAYPDSGITNLASFVTYEEIKNYLKALDIAYARTLRGDNNLFRLPEDWYAWMPTAHHANPNLMQYIDEFLSIDLSPGKRAANRFPRLFYLWGHSYEFENNHNWELLESICEKLSGKPDIWYATNMEIYRYVSAYESLEYSADGKMIHNPTAQTVWMEYDGNLFSVDAQQTLLLA